MRQLVLGLTLMLASGCSVMMAASGEKGADMNSTLKVGRSRQEVWNDFGLPRFSEQRSGARVDYFEVKSGTGPSYGRAAFWLLLDLASLFAWELAGTPIELSNQPLITNLWVQYNDRDQVRTWGSATAGQS